MLRESGLSARARKEPRLATGLSVAAGVYRARRLGNAHAVHGYRALSGSERQGGLPPFREKGRLMPDGVGFVGSWVAADVGRCFQLVECDDITLLQRWGRRMV